MGTVNKVILVGNLGADPELRYTSKGTPVCNLSVATSSTWKDDQGMQQSRTSWHRVVCWGKQGELCKQYLSKGRQVYVEGRLQSRSYLDNEGHKKYSTEVISHSVVFLGGGSRVSAGDAPEVAAGSGNGSAVRYSLEQPGQEVGGREDSIPF